VSQRDEDEIADHCTDLALALLMAEGNTIASAIAALGDRQVTDADVRRSLLLYVAELEHGVFADRWGDKLSDPLSDAMDLGGSKVAKQLGGDFNIDSKAAQKALDQRTEQVGKLVGKTSADRILDSYREARDNGEDASALAGRIRDDAYDADSVKARADLIGSLETDIAIAVGGFLVAKQYGATKTWLHSGNPKVPRDEHVAMDGETVPVDEPFSNGMMYPRDPNADISDTANCGCEAEYSDGSGDDDGEDGD
jgi:hypothetical protein